MIMAEAISTSGDEFTDDDEDEEELDPRVHVSLCIHRVLCTDPSEAFSIAIKDFSLSLG